MSHGFLKISVDVEYPSHQTQSLDFNEADEDLSSESEKSEISENDQSINDNATAGDARMQTLAPTYVPTIAHTVEEKEPDLLPPKTYAVDDKSAISINIMFHRFTALERNKHNTTMMKTLTCSYTSAQLRDIFQQVSSIWVSQAKIRFMWDWNEATKREYASESLMKDYHAHLKKFPSTGGLPWTSTDGGTLNPVFDDLMRMFTIKRTRWSLENEIHVYCLGAFVGYNGAGRLNSIFLRSTAYHETDTDMDPDRFARVLAHEIGHLLHLPHPSTKLCGESCKEKCNLMCQQRALPLGVDPRFARRLSLTQISVARSWARKYDTLPLPVSHHFLRVLGEPMNQTNIAPPVIASFNGVSGTSTMGKVYFAEKLEFPLISKRRVKISRIRFTLESSMTIKPCWVGLVTAAFSDKPLQLGSERRLVTRFRAVGWVGRDTFPSTSSSLRLSKMPFVDVGFSWWTPNRHLEADVIPPIEIFEDQSSSELLVGLFVSDPTVSVSSLQKENAKHYVGAYASSLVETSSSSSARKGSYMDVTALSEIKGSVPKFNIVITDEL